MSRYIDAEWLLRFFEPFSDNYHTPLGVLRACIDDAPSIDIVRCRECKYFIDNLTEDDTDEAYDSCRWDWSRKIPTADDFCSYGEREGE